MRPLAFIFYSAVAILIYLAFNQEEGTEPIIDTELQPIVDEWKNLLDSSNIEYQNGFNRVDSIKLVSSMEKDLAGHFNKANGFIQISEDQISAGYYTARVVVFHELGHYVFDLEHSDSNSIMASNLTTESFYQENWQSIINEYINECKDNEFEARY